MSQQSIVHDSNDDSSFLTRQYSVEGITWNIFWDARLEKISVVYEENGLQLFERDVDRNRRSSFIRNVDLHELENAWVKAFDNLEIQYRYDPDTDSNADDSIEEDRFPRGRHLLITTFDEHILHPSLVLNHIPDRLGEEGVMSLLNKMARVTINTQLEIAERNDRGRSFPRPVEPAPTRKRPTEHHSNDTPAVKKNKL